MPKQIIFNDIYTIEITLAKDEDNIITIHLVYGLIDDGGIKWTPKRIAIDYDNLTPTQKAAITKVITGAENKAKEIEGLLS